MKPTLLFSLFLVSTVAYCQDSTQNVCDTASDGVFKLGEVIVTASRTKGVGSVVNAAEIQRFAKTDVARALNVLPGITLSAVGPRNESMVYLRGFDLRQVPLLIDGVPVYIPYDGYVDLARFTTFDLAEVNVSKGYTSIVYGPNALGGAINLITRKPVKKFEFNGASGWMSGGYRTNINVGSNLGKFYIQGGFSKLVRDSFPLSDDFVPARTEQGGWRNNSYSEDEKYNIKIAFTPNNRSEYAISYINQQGKKGTPPYAGSDTLNSQFRNPRFWQWPYWNKESLYFISSTGFKAGQYIKTRLYYGKFRNLLNSYNDANYTAITRPYAFKSYYNDYSFGGIAEYGQRLSAKDEIKATVQYKQDVHRENNEGEPVRTMSDGTFTVGVENEFRFTPKLLLRTGVSFNNRSSIQAQNYNPTTKQISDYPDNSNNAFNVQGGLEFGLNEKDNLNLAVARKTRFATTKDRYSYRMGTAIPNPDLNAESVVNYELGYKRSDPKLNAQAALFYSRISNTILMVNNVQRNSVTNVWQSQLQNVGKSEYLGVEAGVDYLIVPSLKAGANYTYIKRNNLTNPNVYFIDVPQHKLFGFLQYSLKDRLTVQVNSEYNSDRYSTSYGTKTLSFALLNTNLSVHVWKWFSLEGGINNIADKNYALAEGYPEPGRNYFFNLLYRL